MTRPPRAPRAGSMADGPSAHGLHQTRSRRLHQGPRSPTFPSGWREGHAVQIVVLRAGTRRDVQAIPVGGRDISRMLNS